MSKRLVPEISCCDRMRWSVGICHQSDWGSSSRRLTVRYMSPRHRLVHLINNLDLCKAINDDPRFRSGVQLLADGSLEHFERETSPPSYRSLLHRKL